MSVVYIAFGVAIVGVSWRLFREGKLKDDWSYPAIALKVAIGLVAAGLIIFPMLTMFKGSADRKRVAKIVGKKMAVTPGTLLNVVRGKR